MKQNKIITILVLSLLTMVLYGQTSVVKAENRYSLTKGNEISKIYEEYKDFIGTCQCKSLTRGTQGQWKDTINITWKWSYIMNGNGIMDEGSYILNKKEQYFTSIRVYDSVNKHWYVSYFTPNPNATPQTWTGGKIDDKIILKKQQQTPQGPAESILTFSNITKKGFNWEGKIFYKATNSSYAFWKIWCKKEE